MLGEFRSRTVWELSELLSACPFALLATVWPYIQYSIMTPRPYNPIDDLGGRVWSAVVPIEMSTPHSHSVLPVLPSTRPVSTIEQWWVVDSMSFHCMH